MCQLYVYVFKDDCSYCLAKRCRARAEAGRLPGHTQPLRQVPGERSVRGTWMEGKGPEFLGTGPSCPGAGEHSAGLSRVSGVPVSRQDPPGGGWIGEARAGGRLRAGIHGAMEKYRECLNL